MNAADLIALIEPVARRFFGEPHDRPSATELRFGSNGWLKVDLACGTWHDLEANTSGNALDLIKHEEGCASEQECLQWLAREGLWSGPRKPPDIPADTMQFIRDGVEDDKQQARVFWSVMIVLKRRGFSVDGIIELLEAHPDGIAKRYCGRLRYEIERVYNKIDQGQPHDDPPDTTLPQTMEALKTMIFPTIKYVVPTVIVEGLTILAGKPKIGKSWLMLHAAIAVARGGFTLGNIHCNEGDVLYCALEDNQRRLQSRGTKLIGIVQDWPKRMQYLCLGQLPRLNAGGIDKLKAWISSVPNPRLIVIDTFVTVRAPKKNNQPNFDADYESGKELQKLANEHGIAIVIVHHLRKADADDPFDTVNATLGLTAVVDTVLVLKRETSGGVVLYGRGRDLAEIDKGMVFDANTCIWRIAGDADDIRRTKERTTVLEAIEEAGEPIGPRDIAAATGMKAPNVRFLLQKLLKEGAIEKAGYGKYRMPSVRSAA